ncbi:MAG: hypothetical protein DDT29_00710 [Dehalococcoidia bacterium]|nr:hypothetical protein [Bacillota bacterium]
MKYNTYEDYLAAVMDDYAEQKIFEEKLGRADAASEAEADAAASEREER